MVLLNDPRHIDDVRRFMELIEEPKTYVVLGYRSSMLADLAYHQIRELLRVRVSGVSHCYLELSNDTRILFAHARRVDDCLRALPWRAEFIGERGDFRR